MYGRSYSPLFSFVLFYLPKLFIHCFEQYPEEFVMMAWSKKANYVAFITLLFHFPFEYYCFNIDYCISIEEQNALFTTVLRINPCKHSYFSMGFSYYPGLTVCYKKEQNYTILIQRII